ncbi:hypothetical protein LWI28_016349 [Acer negundo]|uniref:Uncharacterized protein n=1 Tax=Acer negundo TaxID=4023 RepID=A0AAD5NNG8_ACENE|nr:hypothetical protein LWI28_016349 [Acer negundo]KAK4842773.1 hypothetical protein QYF36_027428 [Acer negundo]
MAETPSKRPRQETQIDDVEETKRHKSYNHILSLLEAEEEEPTQDLSSLITTLQQELSSDSVLDPTPKQTADNDLESNLTTATGDDSVANSSTSSPTSSCSKEDEEDDGQRVIRHLLEASDDELGIPNMDVVSAENGVYGDGDFNGGDVFALCDGLLWELEDEAANYYTLLQSELFM